MTSSYENGLQEIAEAFLADHFPDETIINVDPSTIDVEAETLQRLQRAGLALAEVIDADGSITYATFLVNETPYTTALSDIYDGEIEGILPSGSHDKAIDSIMDGTFDASWALFLPGQQG